MAGEIGAEPALEEDESHSVNAASAIPSPMGPLARIARHWLSALRSRIAKRRAARLRRLRSRR
jgi:hypothetical protein